MAAVFKRKDRKGYRIDYTDLEGRRHRPKIGGSKRVAEEVLDDILGKKARREFLGVIEDSPISFADFAEEWWRRIKHTIEPRTQERWRSILDKHLKPAFPGSLRAVTAAAAEAYVARRVEQKAAASTINAEATVLKHLMRRATQWEFRSKNPFLDSQGQPLAGMKRLREPAGRVRFLTLEKIDRLIAACARKPYLKAFTILLLNSGLRRNEALSLTPSSVDWTNEIANLEKTKNGEARHVPLNSTALEALRSLPRPLDGGPLFPFKPNQISVEFKRAVRRAGIKDFKLHDARHTFASYAAMAGTGGRALQTLLGHKDGRMTARYSHLSDGYLAGCVDRVQLGGKRPEPTKADKAG